MSFITTYMTSQTSLTSLDNKLVIAGAPGWAITKYVHVVAKEIKCQILQQFLQKCRGCIGITID